MKFEIYSYKGNRVPKQWEGVIGIDLSWYYNLNAYVFL